MRGAQLSPLLWKIPAIGMVEVALLAATRSIRKKMALGEAIAGIVKS